MTSFSVSVAMTTFNGAAYLEQQLADLAVQSALPSELVVCDDGSTDDTLGILERFAACAPFPVQIYRNPERLGYRANFLKCAALCRSELVAFCDQDDRWLPEKIEIMTACFEDPDVLLAFHGAEIIADDQRPLGKLTSKPRPVGASPPLSGSPWTFALGFTQMFRRWLCDQDRWWPISLDHNSTDQRLAHDQWYFFLASTLGTIVNIDAPLVRYRQHDANEFGWAKAKRSRYARYLGRIRAARWLADRRFHAATQRAVILELAASRLPKPYSERAIDGAIAYQRLARLCEQRAAIYGGSTLVDRARSFSALISQRGYGPHPWCFGARALGMDLMIGIPGFTPPTQSPPASLETEAARVATSRSESP